MPEILESPSTSKAAQTALEQNPAHDQGEQRTADAPKGEPNDLEAKIQSALKGMVRAYDLESEVIRRHHVRRFLEAEEFWKGNQHLIWSERRFRWQTPFEWATENKRDEASVPRYQYVTNIYRSLGLSVIAAISQRLPKVRFQPKSSKNEIDIATARAASDVVDLVERNNELDLMAVRCAYLLWTQGIFGAYVRYVLDKDYGTQQIPQVEMGQVKVHEDEYLCPHCGMATAAAELNAGGGLVPERTLACPKCGGQLTDADFRPEEYGTGPVVTGTIEYPDGREVISIFGGMNLKMMPTAETMKETSYLFLVREKHAADIKAAYPLKARSIGAGGSGAPSDNNYERYARLSLFDSSPNYRNAQPFSKHVTLMDAWLRPRAFWYEDDDEIVTELLKRYPNGVRVVMAGDEFLEAIPEDMDDYWEICRPMPGVGMYVDGVGADVIPIAKRKNDADNIQAEHVEFGSAPPVMVDGRYINLEAMRNKRMSPGQYMAVAIKDSPQTVKLADMTKQMEVKIDNMVASGQYGNSLVEMAQMVSGALPSIFGGSLQGNETASGYAMARVQSLGKLNLFWRAVMQFWARLQMKSVECFKRNRTQDYEHVITDRSGDYVSKFIRLENLKGNITAHPEADQDFPASWAEIRDNVLQMLKLAPAQTLALLMHADNSPLLKKVLSNPEMMIPGEDDREKQFREIQDLLQGQPTAEMAPVPGPVDPASGQPLAPPPIDAMTGQPAMQATGKMIPTVEAEPFVDNHVAHIQTAQGWAVSDDGIMAKKQNPAGYANVMAHILSHYEAQAYEQAQIQKITAEQMMAAGIAPQLAGQEPEGNSNSKDGGKDQDKAGSKPPSGSSDNTSSQFPGATQPIADIAKQPI